MSEVPGQIPKDVLDEAAALAARLSLLISGVERDVALYERKGATPEQAANLSETRAYLNILSQAAINGVTAIEEADIVVHEAVPEVDEELAYRTVKAFIVSRGDGIEFSRREVIDHLAELGIHIPPRRLSIWIRNWSDDLIEEYREQGTTVRWWESNGKGDQKAYAFAVVNAPTAVAPTKVAPVDEPVSYVWKPKQVEEITVTDTHRAFALQLIEQAKPNIRAKALKERMVGRFNIDFKDAGQVFGELIADGTVFTDRREGGLYYSLTPPAPRVQQQTLETSKREERELDAHEKELAKIIVELLAQPGRDLRKFVTPQEISAELRERFGRTESPKQLAAKVNKISRRLHEQNLLSRNERAHGVWKVGLPSVEVGVFIRRQGPEKIHELIDSGGQYESTES